MTNFTPTIQLSAAGIANWNAMAQTRVVAQTALSSGISSSATSITFDSVAAMSSPGSINGAITAVLIDSEVILLGAISGTTASSCTRGAMGTTAASHSGGAPVQILQWASIEKWIGEMAVKAIVALPNLDSSYLAAVAAAASADAASKAAMGAY